MNAIHQNGHQVIARELLPDNIDRGAIKPLANHMDLLMPTDLEFNKQDINLVVATIFKINRETPPNNTNL